LNRSKIKPAEIAKPVEDDPMAKHFGPRATFPVPIYNDGPLVVSRPPDMDESYTDFEA
jgi:hypothetical protein